MRVTSSMMTNNMMMNVNRSMRSLMRYELMFSTQRKIQVPSDNPLIAARAMKFTSNLAANEDFQNNVANGLAWMDVTEGALDGILQVLLNEIRDILNNAHNDPRGLEGRQIMARSIRQFTDQIGHHMNAQFAGRYVFSGLRTNLPPIFTTDQPDLRFEITQNFELRDIERTRALQVFQPEPDDQVMLPYYPQVHILKLAFNNIRTDAAGNPIIQVVGADGNPFTVIMRSQFDREATNPITGDTYPGAFNPASIPENHVVLIQETGELVFNVDDTIGADHNFPVRVTYERHGFSRNELNPAVYFESTLLQAPTGHALFPAHQLGQVFNGPGDNQHLIYEFSSHTTIPVNTLARNVFTDKLFADLNRLINFIEGIVPTDPARLRAQFENLFPEASDYELQRKMADHIADENQRINLAMNDRINNMLFLIDRHSAQVRREVTDIGSRGRRLELFQNRLEQDEGSLTRLYTTNIAADMARVATLLATAEARYLASVRVGVNIINVTLANFLQV